MEPKTDFIYDPMGFTGVSVGDDLEKRISKEFQEVASRRAEVLLQRFQGVCHSLTQVIPASIC